MPNYELAAERAARKYNVDPRIFKAMIRQESGFNPNAKSGAGAEGIAQFMPGTAAGYGVNLHDGRVTDDLEGAARYIADNLRKTGGNYHQALSIYNSGKPDAYRDPHFAGGQTYDYVRTILGGAKGEGLSASGGGAAPARGASLGAPSARTVTTQQPTFDQAGFDQANKNSILANYLAKRNPNNALLRTGAISTVAPDPAQFTGTKLVGHVTSLGYSPTTAGLLQTLTQRANQVDSHHLPYSWGGGHGGKTKPSDMVPVDCSGAVSEILGIDPRVASQFKTFGKPGAGRVTIAAKDTHVLIRINGHWFGTSQSNPGGGAGWIEQSQISPGYLAGFTLRHIDA